MTTTQIDAFARRVGGYVAAAQFYADIADQFSGLGDAYFDTLSASYRRSSLLFLARLMTITGA
jgi:hypothetical protein